METEPLPEAVLMKKARRNIKIRRCVGEMHGQSYREIKLYRKWCFQTFLSLCSSKIKLNGTLVNTNINLQLAYYILEFHENLFSRAFRAQRRI